MGGGGLQQPLDEVAILLQLVTVVAHVILPQLALLLVALVGHPLAVLALLLVGPPFWYWPCFW